MKGIIFEGAIDFNNPPIGEPVYYRDVIYILKSVTPRGAVLTGAVTDMVDIPSIYLSQIYIKTKDGSQRPLAIDQWNQAATEFYLSEATSVNFQPITYKDKVYYQCTKFPKGKKDNLEESDETIFKLSREKKPNGEYLYPTFKDVIDQFNAL